MTSANVRDGRIDWNTTRFVSRETYRDYMTRGIPRPGDVIFTMEAPLGESAVVPDERMFSLAQRILLLRAKPEIAGGHFLAKALSNPPVRETIYARATGTTVKGIAPKRLKQIFLPIAPLPEQRRIVAYLDDLQAKLDALKKLQDETAAELDALLPSILDRAFRGQLSGRVCKPAPTMEHPAVRAGASVPVRRKTVSQKSRVFAFSCGERTCGESTLDPL